MAGASTASSTSRAAATPRRSASRRCTSRTSSRRPAASGRSSRTSTSIPVTRELDLDSERFTENTRGAYPLHFIGNADPTGMAGPPRNVVFLTADAFGVLPPISRLTRDQAAYHFISGYTAKLAGTEIGVKEPQRDVLGLLRRAVHAPPPGRVRRRCSWSGSRSTDVPVWLVNTGWTGGPYGDRPADEHQPHPLDGPGGPLRRARGRADGGRPDLRRRGPDCRPGRPDRGPPAADHLAGPAAYDRRRAGSRRCSTRTSRPTPTA